MRLSLLLVLVGDYCLKVVFSKLAISEDLFFFQDDTCANHSTVDQLRNRPLSSVDSIFNCDLPNATCTYYYPSNFFDSDCGLGRHFRQQILHDTQAKMKNHTLWINMPAIGFPTLRIHSQQERSTSETNISSTPLAGEHLSFIHVHKAGGSSLHDAFNTLSTNNRAKLIRHRWWSPGQIDDLLMLEKTRTDLQHAITYPSSLPFESDKHVIFAVVRNPVERFISSIGQAFGAPGSNGAVAQELSNKCIKETSKETLRCVIDHIKEHSFFVELHFSPQVLDLSFTTMFEDVPIAVFPFQELPNVLKYLGLEQSHKRRDGSQSNYRPHAILKNMTMDDYDGDMMKDICEIYKVDVIMQRSMGIEVPQCDPFIITN
jgi:hypothetical protein